MSALPRDVDCPYCETKAGHGCRSAGSFSIPTHAARWKAIGIKKPTQEQRDADYEDGVRRDTEFRHRFFAEWREREKTP